MALNLAILLFLTLHEVLNRFQERNDDAGKERRARLRGILVAGLLAFVAITGGWLYYLRSGAMAARESVHSLLSAMATLQVSQIAGWRRERLGEGQLLAQVPNVRADVEALVRQPGNPLLETRVQGWLEALRIAYEYESATIFDPQGKTLLTTPKNAPLGPPRPPVDLAEALAGADVTLTDIHQEKDTSTHLEVLVAIGTSKAGPIGVVSLRIDPRHHIFPMLAVWPTNSDSGESLLLRREGAEPAYLSPLRYLPAAGSASEPAVSGVSRVARLAVRDGGDLHQGLDYRGALVLFASRSIPGTPWVLEVKIDETEAFAPARREAQLLSAMVGVLLLAVGQAGFVVWRRREAEVLRQTLLAERLHRGTSERLALFTRYANDAVFMFDEAGRIVEASERVRDIYGRTPDDMKKLSVPDLRPPTEAAKAVAHFNEVMGSGGAVFEENHLRHNGDQFPVEISCRPVIVDGCRYVFSIVRDISERRRHQDEIVRLSQLYAAMMHVNQAIVHAKDRESFLNQVCRVLVESGGFLMVWVARADPATGRVLAEAHYGDTSGYLERVRSRADLFPGALGPMAKAVRDNRLVVCNDFLNDPETAPWHEPAAIAGFKATIALPLPLPRSSPERGALGAYTADAGVFGDEEILLLKQAASDIVFGLDSLKNEEARRKADADLHTSLREKEALLKEVHHRVGNNLQVILSLLRLESARADSGAAMVLKEMQGRIHSMAQLHESIYRSGNFASVDLADYLERLSSQLGRLHGAGNRSIQITMDASRVALDIDRAIPCGLLVNELVTNCFKHAFPNGGPGEIRIGLRSTADCRVLLEVCDNGAGLTADFETRRSKSLGLQMVTDLARQIKGELEVLPEEGAGVRFRVTFAEGAVVTPRYPLPV